MARSNLGVDPRSEREKAAYGPRTLKTPGSREWCWQTLDGLVRDYRFIDERFREIGQALRELKSVRAWKIIPAERPYGSLGRMLAVELKTDSRTLQREIKDAEQRTVGTRGGDRRSAQAKADQSYNVTLNQRGNSRAFILGCLDRDGHADLAEKVRAGAVSARKAGQLVGYEFLKPLSALDQIRKLLPKLSSVDRDELRRALDEIMGHAA
jgi:hypothetical protein